MSALSVKAGSFAIGGRGDIFGAQLNGGLAILIYIPIQGIGGLVHMSGSRPGILLLKEFLAKLLNKIGDVPIFGKMFGSVTPAVLIELRRCLADYKIELMCESLDSTGTQTIYFYPESGRARISTAKHATDAVPVTAKPRKTVLIVDDSRTIRQLLTKVLSMDPDLEVIGEAGDADEAARFIDMKVPDVMTLDVNMPGMDGVTFLERLLPKHPIPTIMITALSKEESGPVLRALEIGAVGYVQKPQTSNLNAEAETLREAVRTAAYARVRRRGMFSVRQQVDTWRGASRIKLIAIGASTGGTEAIRAVLADLPKGLPPIVIVQHIPPVFSKSFADRLAAETGLPVKEVDQGDRMETGGVYVAPGGRHLKIVKQGSDLVAHLSDAEPVNRHRPSVDVLFDSVAIAASGAALGVILTGMGNDGARGLLAIKDSGSTTMAQDEATSVVYGMPKEAAKLGAATEIVALDRVAHRLLVLVKA